MKRSFSLSATQGVIFFIVLFYGLFLGDGYQTLIEPYVAGSLVVLFSLFWVTKRSRFTLPHSLQMAWSGIFIAYLVSAAFSRSIGYSITEIVRIFCGYLTFVLFYNIYTKELPSLLLKLTLTFVVMSSLAGLVFLIFPTLASSLPPINLLFAFYGHNHLSVLLLFVLPIATELLLVRRSALRILFASFVVVSLVATFSRGALLIAGLYFLVRIVLLRGNSQMKYKSIFFICACVLGGFVVYWSSTQKIQIPDAPSHLQPQIAKVNPLKNRLPYWEQALKSFHANPILGNGPGTFYLESLRFQSKPDSYSYYAHSYPLQLLSEVGGTGFALMFSLLFLLGKRLVYALNKNKTVTNESSYLLWGCGMIFAYSFIDFSFSFLIVWLMFWAVVGAIYASLTQASTNKRIPVEKTVALVLGGLFIFFVLYAGGLAMSKNYAETAFLMMPFSTDRALDVIDFYRKEEKKIPKKIFDLINFFHKNEPEVQKQFIEYSKIVSIEHATMYYQKALYNNPKNMYLRHEYISFLLEHLAYDQIQLELERRGNIDDLPERWSEEFYKIGILYIDKNQAPYAIPLWRNMVYTTPSWSHLNIELASLYLTVDDTFKAKQVLLNCANDLYAKDHCILALEWLANNNFPKPGIFRKEIIR